MTRVPLGQHPVVMYGGEVSLQTTSGYGNAVDAHIHTRGARTDCMQNY